MRFNQRCVRGSRLAPGLELKIFLANSLLALGLYSLINDAKHLVDLCTFLFHMQGGFLQSKLCRSAGRQLVQDAGARMRYILHVSQKSSQHIHVEWVP